ncbi:MAG: hypothetical protein O3A20_00345 [Planctomycetota bacterium]|nr:hypothetical protein [Planctomycetota bacterium]
MDDRKLQPLIREIRSQNGRRFAEAAYFFVLEALDFTIFLQGKGQAPTESRHINGRELLDGIRRYAQEEFGPLAPFAFRSWGVTRTEDFGALVFQMCEAGLLNRAENDHPRDFANGFDFEQAFLDPTPMREAARRGPVKEEA